MSPFEHELVGFIARFPWRPMSWQRRAKLDFVRRREGERSGAPWALARDLTDRERHLLYRLAWSKMEKVHSPLALAVKQWLAAHPKPPTRAEQRKAQRAERERAKARTREREEPRLL